MKEYFTKLCLRAPIIAPSLLSKDMTGLTWLGRADSIGLWSRITVSSELSHSSLSSCITVSCLLKVQTNSIYPSWAWEVVSSRSRTSMSISRLYRFITSGSRNYDKGSMEIQNWTRVRSCSPFPYGSPCGWRWGCCHCRGFCRSSRSPLVALLGVRRHTDCRTFSLDHEKPNWRMDRRRTNQYLVIECWIQPNKIPNHSPCPLPPLFSSSLKTPK